jgi:CRP-like cAMP-binding protein
MRDALPPRKIEFDFSFAKQQGPFGVCAVMLHDVPPNTERILDLLVAKVEEHGTLVPRDIAALRALEPRTRRLAAGEDVVRQGEKPTASVMMLSGMLARHHTLPGGDRQYLSFHIAGDMPDLQSLFLNMMDHSVCAMGGAEVATFPHRQLQRMLLDRPGVGFALWRMTLVDAAIFRQAITNNSARPPAARLGHFFCEQLQRAREAKLAAGDTCPLPLTQEELGQALGLSLVSVNRALQKLRRDGLVEFRNSRLDVRDWTRLAALAGFDDGYLHCAKQSYISRTPFNRRR